MSQELWFLMVNIFLNFFLIVGFVVGWILM